MSKRSILSKSTIAAGITMVMVVAVACGGGEPAPREQGKPVTTTAEDEGEVAAEEPSESDPIACSDPTGDPVNTLAEVEGLAIPDKTPKPVGEDIVGIELVAAEDDILNITLETAQRPKPEEAVWSIQFYEGSKAKPRFAIGFTAASPTEVGGGLFSNHQGWGWGTQSGGMWSGEIDGTSVTMDVPIGDLPQDPAGMRWFATGERQLSKGGKIAGSMFDGCPDVKIDTDTTLPKDVAKLPEVPSL